MKLIRRMCYMYSITSGREHSGCEWDIEKKNMLQNMWIHVTGSSFIFCHKMHAAARELNFKIKS